MTNLILPCNPLSGQGFDEQFAYEAAAMQRTSVQTGTVDHDELVNHHTAVVKLPRWADSTSLYRGWMMNNHQYSVFAQACTDKGAPLLTSVEQYEVAHYLPGWIETFKDLTFPTVIVEASASLEEVLDAALHLEGDIFFIKDFVKSRKEEPALSIAPGRVNLYPTIQRFVAAQDDYIAGGVVIREFVPLADDRVEIRGWWRDGVWRAITAHPDYAHHDEFLTPPQELLDEVSRRLNDLGLYFVSVDFTLTAEGNWVVIEIGDGQVSGFPDTITDDVIKSILV